LNAPEESGGIPGATFVRSTQPRRGPSARSWQPVAPQPVSPVPAFVPTIGWPNRSWSRT